MRVVLSILCGLLLGIVAFATPSRPSTSSPLYLPLIGVSPRVVRGSAGGYLDGTSALANVEWMFQYYPPATTHDGLSYKVVPLVSARLMAMAGNPLLTVTYAGQYWMLENEGDNCDPNAGDCLTPAQGATKLKEYADLLEPQGARLLCCALLHDPSWMDAMLASYQAQYNTNALDRLVGITFHAYATVGANCTTDACYLSHWTTHVQAWKNWIASKQGAYPIRTLEAWCSECAWHPSSEPDIATSVRHMQLICDQLKTMGLTRYAWFYGGADSQVGTQNLGLFNTDKSLSPLGVAYSNC